MKKSIIVAIAFTFLFTCNSDDDNEPVELLGTWLLIEQYADPGDGSGDFVAVDSNKTLEFYTNGTIQSNGNLCTMNADSGEETTGTYDALEYTIDPNGCNSNNFVLIYDLGRRDLIVHYPCIEGCSQKFSKID